MVANPDQLTDAEIIAQVLAGNQARYRLLVERHQQAVFNAAYRLLGQREEAAAPDGLVDQVMANLPAQTFSPLRAAGTSDRPIFLGQLALAVQIGVGLVLLLTAVRLITPNFNGQFLWLPWLTLSEMVSSFGHWLADLGGYVNLLAQKWSPIVEIVRLDISPTLAMMLAAGLGIAWLAGNTLLLAPRQSTPKNGGV
jgi:hypothetical protein